MAEVALKPEEQEILPRLTRMTRILRFGDLAGWGVLLGGCIASMGWVGLAVSSRSQTGATLAGLGWAHALGWLGFSVALLSLYRLGPRASGSASIGIGLLFAVFFRCLGLWGEPVLEDDFARYLWDGWRFVASGNPYDTIPMDFFFDPDVPERMGTVLSQINHPDLPTLYGPVCQYVFALAAWIGAGQLAWLQCLLLVSEACVLWLLWRNARLCLPVVILWGWCPLMIHEIGFNAHPDVLGVALLLFSWDAALRRRALIAGLALGLAISTKVFAVVLAPFILRHAGVRGIVGTIGAWAVAYLPFWLQGSGADWAVLLHFGQTWEFNSSLVGLLGGVGLGDARRPVASLFAAVVLGWWWWRWRRLGKPLEDLPLDRVWAVFFLCSAVVNPWYLLWMAPFVILRPTGWGWAAIAVVPLSYFTGLNMGRTDLAPYEHPWWLRWIEYGLVLTVAIAAMLIRKREVVSVEKSPAA